MDMVWMPLFVSTGKMPRSFARAFSRTPNIPGREGPVTSASRTAVLYPFFADMAASKAHTEDLPTPPLPDTTAMTFFTLAPGSRLFKRLPSALAPQLLAHEEQSCEQFSLINFSFRVAAACRNPSSFDGIPLYFTPSRQVCQTIFLFRGENLSRSGAKRLPNGRNLCIISILC